jgi:hypothetical protein
MELTHTITCTKLTLFCNDSVGDVLCSSVRISRSGCFVKQTRFHVMRPNGSTVGDCENDCPMQCDDIYFVEIYKSVRGPGSSVGIATAYGLDGPEIESRWGRDFPHLSRPALRST